MLFCLTSSLKGMNQLPQREYLFHKKMNYLRLCICRLFGKNPAIKYIDQSKKKEAAWSNLFLFNILQLQDHA
jgi:hypothetical protein